MKICFFHDAIFIKKGKYYYTTGTLTNSFFSEYLKVFESVSVVTRVKSYSEKYIKYIKEENKITLNNINFNCVSNYLNSKKQIEEEVQKCDFAILRVHSFISLLAYYYCKKYNVKYLAESVSCAFDCLWYHSFLGKIISPAMFIMTKQIVKEATAVTYVSKKFLQKRYPTNAKFVLSCSDVKINAVDLQVFEKKKKSLHQLKERKIIIGNIANLDLKYKGQHYLIKAVSELVNEGYDIELQFVGGGTGDYLKKLSKKYNIENKVKYVGVLNHKQIFDFLQNIDIYIQPSNAESHGRVILEAMSMSCPVIGSSTGGIPELVNPKNIFTRKKYKDLKKKIESLIATDGKLDCIYSYNKAKKFTIEKLSKKRTAFYKLIAEEFYD